MNLEMNKAIMFSIATDVDSAISRSESSANEIFNMLKTFHPEITYSKVDWDLLSQEIQEKIVMRIQKTLASIT